MGVWRTDNYNLELCPALFRNTLKLGSTGVALAEIALQECLLLTKENGDVFFLPSLSSYSALLLLAGSIKCYQ